MKEIEEFFITDINNREKMSKKLSKYMTTLHYTDKALLVLSGASNDVSLCSFTTAIDAPVVIASANICLVFLTSNGNLKTFLKTMGKEKNKHRKIALLARTKLNIIQKIIYKVLIDSDVSHDEFTLATKEENYCRLKKTSE